MAVKPFEIPLSPKAVQFDISLVGITYSMRIVWNPISLCWVLDIADSSGAALVNGIPLVTGADLLAQYAYLGLSGGLVVTTDDGIGVPTYEGLGESGHLYFVVPATVEQTTNPNSSIYDAPGGVIEGGA